MTATPIIDGLDGFWTYEGGIPRFGVGTDVPRSLEQDRAVLYLALRGVREQWGHAADPECGCDDCIFLTPIDSALAFVESRSYHKPIPHTP